MWGLDDYQFLPFIWGSAQLIGHPFIRPGSILNKEVLDTCWEDYLYLSCVRFVKQACTCCPARPLCTTRVSRTACSSSQCTCMPHGCWGLPTVL